MTDDAFQDYTRGWAGAAAIERVRLSTGGSLRMLTAGRGPALLLLHTMRTQLDYFQRLVPLLTDSHTVIAIDLPGLGWSDIQPGAVYDEPSVRRAVIEVVRRLGLDDLTLVGESMGATLALTAAAELGSAIRRVVAVNTYDYPGGVERANLLASVVVKAMRIPGLGLIPAKLEDPKILGNILAGGFIDRRHLPADLVAELIRSGKRPGFAHVATGYFRNIGSFIAAHRRFADVKAAVDIVYGATDWSRPAERRRVADLVPNPRVTTLPNTRHFASLERPQLIAEIILNGAAPGGRPALTEE
jgi:pimeloyl-ACP methyl ester carboxylesterase